MQLITGIIQILRGKGEKAFQAESIPVQMQKSV